MDLDVGISRAVDDFYDGTVAAACGGTTSIVDHMAFGPAGVPLHYQFEVYKKLAEGKAVIDYGFHGTAQHVDADILAELETMAADGIPSVKAYLTYGFKLNDADVLQILQKMKEIGGITAFHCENHDIVEYLKQKHKSGGKNFRGLARKKPSEPGGSRSCAACIKACQDGGRRAGLYCPFVL